LKSRPVALCNILCNGILEVIAGYEMYEEVDEENERAVKPRFRRLGRTLVKWGVISEAQLREAVAKQEERGGVLGQWLIDLGFVTNEAMDGFLERFHRRRHLSVAQIRVASDVLEAVPKHVAWAWTVMPLDVSENELVAAVPNAAKTECIAALADVTDLTILPVSCPEEEIVVALRRHYGEPEGIDKHLLLGSPPMTKYRFETYVVGEGNRNVYEAAVTVAGAPGRKHNPLFIYGDVGHGKTHLLNAIGNRILQENPLSLVLFLPAIRFADELLRAVEENKLDEFRMTYARTHVLLLDDIQFLADQRAVQEEFVKLFDIMQARGRQIVVTSDRPPEEVDALAERVRSDLGAGKIIPVENPSVSMKAAILMEKRREHGWSVPDFVISMVAKDVDGDVRKLEGVLRTISARINLDSGYDVDEIVSSALSAVRS
jgi:chromosomal replication initiator protein